MIGTSWSTVLEKPKKFRVTELTFRDFIYFSSLLKNHLFLRKVNGEGEPFHWQDIKCFFYTQEKHGKLLHKTSLEENNHLGSSVSYVEVIRIQNWYQGTYTAVHFEFQHRRNVILWICFHWLALYSIAFIGG
jgi:hypothetical protein